MARGLEERGEDRARARSATVEAIRTKVVFSRGRVMESCVGRQDGLRRFRGTRTLAEAPRPKPVADHARFDVGFRQHAAANVPRRALNSGIKDFAKLAPAIDNASINMSILMSTNSSMQAAVEAHASLDSTNWRVVFR